MDISLKKRLKAAILSQIEYLEADEMMTSKERIEYVTRLLPYCIGKVGTLKEEEKEEKESDVLMNI